MAALPPPPPPPLLAPSQPPEQEWRRRSAWSILRTSLVGLVIGYPTPKDERGILRRFLEGNPQPQKVLAPEQILGMQQLVGQVHVEDEILDSVVRLSGATRQQARIFLGASPRASLALVQAARARALSQGRPFVIPDDAKALAVHVLAHRLVLTPEAEMEGAQREALVQEALEQTPHRQG